MTGGNAGLGLAVARELARSGLDVTIGCRSSTRGAAAAGRLREELGAGAGAVTYDALDCASAASCQAFARRWAGRRLDVLVHNAGTGDMTNLAKPTPETCRASALVFTNVLAPVLLTRLLLDGGSLAATGGPEASRVVFLSSVTARYAPTPRRGRVVPDLLEKTDGPSLYAPSKLACALLARELPRRVPGLRVAAVDPGAVWTGIFDAQGFDPKDLLARPARWAMSALFASPQSAARTVTHFCTGEFAGVGTEPTYLARGGFATDGLTGTPADTSIVPRSLKDVAFIVWLVLGAALDELVRRVTGGRVWGAVRSVRWPAATNDRSLCAELWDKAADALGLPRDQAAPGVVPA